MNKQQKISQFDPNGVGATNSGIFGLPFDYVDASIVIVPVPWDLTTSSIRGTARGPQEIFNYSSQIDLYDADVKDAWKTGVYMKPINAEWQARNEAYSTKATEYITFLEEGGVVRESAEMRQVLQELNRACAELKDWVREECATIAADGKIPVILGGEHSSPLGLLEVLAKRHSDFGILQIDAHLDLREAYEGFPNSHASIMYNALQLSSVSQLVSVGIRDACEAEIAYTQEDQDRIKVFYDLDLKRAALEQVAYTWAAQCDRIIASLPQKVYISFDIDGLDPKYCPHTGTSVPGGLEIEEAFLLIKKVVESGRTIIGFDLCEVACGGKKELSAAEIYNANVGARVLYRLCNMTALSNGLTA